jgi:TRAP-type transport system periplasmic protein
MNSSKLAALLLCLCLSPLPAAETVVIKFATLAPEGSAWMKAVRKFTAEVSAKTADRVKFRIYAGGVSGDEKDVVRKMRMGQLQAGGFTGVGIGEIAPEVRVIDTPFLFKNQKEIDHIYKAFDADFRGYFEKRGYVLLGWAEVGTINVFSNTPVTKLDDMKSVKMWLWEGDPIAEATFEALKLKPIPLSVADVMTSLQTGMINGVYGSPLSVIALQWFSKMKYVFSLPITNASGAVVLTKKAFDQLSAEDQKTLLALGDKHMRELTLASRKENEASAGVLKKKGLQYTQPAGAAVTAEFELAGEAARRALTGKVYPRELLEKVENSLKAFRGKKS